MKITLGTVVSSEFGTGPVIAMTKKWCIHADKHGEEYALAWSDVSLPLEAPDAPASALAELTREKNGTFTLTTRKGDEVSRVYSGGVVVAHCTGRLVGPVEETEVAFTPVFLDDSEPG